MPGGDGDGVPCVDSAFVCASVAHDGGEDDKQAEVAHEDVVDSEVLWHPSSVVDRRRVA